MANLFDTICAIATPIGVGGIGIIRLSGPEAFGIAKTLCPSVSTLVPRYVTYASLIDPATDTPIDKICLIAFTAPHSFTGEDVVEFHLHSGPYILKKALECCLSCGARLAEKGEFSKRAFLNGKLDLTQAESIIDLIHAKTEKPHRVALGHHRGHLYHHIQQLRTRLIRLLEQVEGSIDFPEEVDAIDRKKNHSNCSICHAHSESTPEAKRLW